MNLFTELKRRNVYKVAVAYAVVGWLLIQVATQVFPFFQIPNWAVRLVVLAIVIGLPIALIIAWAFEITPEGIKRTEAVEGAGRRRKGGLWLAVVLFGAALSLGLFFLGRYTSQGGNAAAPELPAKSIAVLPFVDLSQARDQEYFCDGISEEILNALAKVEGLRVVARTSSFAFKGKNPEVGEIAQKLGVQHVVEGSLRREGDRIRVTAQLINARDGFHLWSDTFERELQGVFAVQDEITRAIVEALKVKLAVASPPRPPPDPQAYDLYLQGLYLSNKSDEENLRKSLSLFRRALDKDPTLASAWTGIAKVWFWLADVYVKPLDAYPSVESAAARALELNEGDAEAHCYLGQARRVLYWDWRAAEREVKRALEVDPNSASAHLWRAWNGLWSGDLDQVPKEIDEAERLDPLSPIISGLRANFYTNLDRLDEALVAAKRTIIIDPTYIYLEPDIARVYLTQGKLDEALAIYLKAQDVTRRPMPGLAITYARLGRLNEARNMLEQLIEEANLRYVPGEKIAEVFVALGDHEEAFHWLNRAVDEHTGNNIATRRELRPLHSDRRFAEVLRRMQLDPAKVLGQQSKR
jgi:TolB-like protein/tetratricopeptide (TPR) repeat protein